MNKPNVRLPFMTIETMNRVLFDRYVNEAIKDGYNFVNGSTIGTLQVTYVAFMVLREGA